ncbi:VOC family protein [Paenibacillus sp. FSL W7-1279]|uniref:VOC family protein n=1 Tax=Paenibacillus TaxID=44249 RepID=UPI001C7D73D0|nr:VOC family protein [Paenibacillus lautus]MBX4148276.1 VOC family protein [Paenibacillus lautus]
MKLQFIPYIMLNGNANEAIAFYEKALDAKVLSKQTFGQAPESIQNAMPSDVKDRVAHSVLRIGEIEMFVADTEPGQQTQPGDRLSICITTNDIEKSEHFYEALQQGGQVITPLQEMYFSPAYAMVTDKFGITFQIFTTR